MNLFSWLFIGHLVGDFLLQNRWMANEKAANITPLLTHAIIYTLSVSAFAQFSGGISLTASLIILLSHALLDRRGFTNYWLRVVNKSEDLLWLNIVSDQCWHLLILAFMTLL